MKWSIFFILITSLFIVSDTFCQPTQNDFISIIDTDTKWYKVQSLQSQAPVSRLEFYASEAIIIENHFYYELFICKNIEGTDCQVKGLFREEDGRLYLRSGNIDILVVDINLEMGDTFTLNQDDVIVTMVDTVIYSDGIERKRIKLTCDQVDPDARVYTLVEGVGFIEEYSDNCMQLISTPLSLVCFEVDENIILSDENSDSCWMTTSVNNLPSIEFNIYPNPTQEVLKVSLDAKLLNIEILDLNGHTLIYFDNTNELNISNLDSGIFIIKVYTDIGVGIDKFVKQ